MDSTEVVAVMVFGDSITYGAWDNNGGWVQRLREPIDIKNMVDLDVAYFIYNLGIVDDTSTRVLKRFESEMKARMTEFAEERIVIFNIGGNDASHRNGKLMVPKEEFRKNVDRLIAVGKKYSKKVIFVGPTPVDEQRTDPVPWWDTLSYKNASRGEYNKIIKDACKKNGVFFIEIFDAMLKLNYKVLLEDGVHPSPAGHLVIYEIVRDFLTKNKILNFETPKTNTQLYESENPYEGKRDWRDKRTK